MMNDKKIARINELYHRSKAEGLTEAEKEEQAALRQEYLEAVRTNLVSQLEHTVIQTPDGRRIPLKKKP